MSEPILRVLSLGAGVQSTTLALLAAKGELPKPDVAIFADTGWEPAKVYEHLDRLEAELIGVDIPVHRVHYRDIRADTLGSWNRLPLFITGDSGKPGMLRRQCTQQYKLNPLKREVRRLLGAKTSRSGAVLRPPAGAVAEQWIGFSTDEIGRVSDKERDPYIVTRYPLIDDLDMSRDDCLTWLAGHGWGDTPKSACVGCPFHSDDMWRELRDERPAEWAQAVAFDQALRDQPPRGVRGVGYLHDSRVPLPLAPLDRNKPDRGSCSPFGCGSGERAS